MLDDVGFRSVSETDDGTSWHSVNQVRGLEERTRPCV